MKVRNCYHMKFLISLFNTFLILVLQNIWILWLLKVWPLLCIFTHMYTLHTYLQMYLQTHKDFIKALELPSVYTFGIFMWFAEFLIISAIKDVVPNIHLFHWVNFYVQYAIMKTGAKDFSLSFFLHWIEKEKKKKKTGFTMTWE